METTDAKAYTPEQLANAEKMFDILTELPKDEQCTVAMIANAFMEGMQAQKRLATAKRGRHLRPYLTP